MMKYTNFSLILLLTALLSHPVQAEVGTDELTTDETLEQAFTLRQQLTQELRRTYPNASAVEIGENLVFKAVSSPAETNHDRLAIVNEDGRGHVTFTGSRFAGHVDYSVFIMGLKPTHRILPGEAISAKDFVNEEMDITKGALFLSRGLIVPANQNLSRLESRQTLLEGQPVMSSAIQRMPDVRKGDAVKVVINSGDLSLTTSGFAVESGMMGKPVRVMTDKTKREMVGMLAEAGKVEVNL